MIFTLPSPDSSDFNSLIFLAILMTRPSKPLSEIRQLEPFPRTNTSIPLSSAHLKRRETSSPSEGSAKYLAGPPHLKVEYPASGTFSSILRSAIQSLSGEYSGHQILSCIVTHLLDSVVDRCCLDNDRKVTSGTYRDRDRRHLNAKNVIGLFSKA